MAPRAQGKPMFAEHGMICHEHVIYMRFSMKSWHTLQIAILLENMMMSGWNGAAHFQTNAVFHNPWVYRSTGLNTPIFILGHGAPTPRIGQLFFHILFTQCVWNILESPIVVWWPPHGTTLGWPKRLYQVFCTDRWFLSHWVRTYCQSAG